MQTSFKNCVSLLIVFLLVFSMSFGVAAAGLSANIIDSQNEIMRITGNTTALTEVSILVLKSGFTPSTVSTDFTSIIHQDVIKSDRNGKIDYSFKISSATASSGTKYEVYAVPVTGSELSTTYNYYTCPEIVSDFSVFLNQQSTIWSSVLKYAPSIGYNNEMMDISIFNSTAYQTVLASKLFENKSNIVAQGMQEFFETYKTAKTEVELLQNIASVGSGNYRDIATYLTVLADITTFNKNKYDALTSDNRDKILKGIYEKRSGFNNAIELAKYVTDYIYDINNTTISNEGGTGGGGGVVVDRVIKYDDSNTVNNNNQSLVVGSAFFDDLTNVNWAVPSIDYLFQKKVINGVDNRTFDPDGTLTREAFTKMVVLAFNVYNPDAKTDFVDVNDNEWYASYVASAKESGLINGISSTEFGVGQPISRQDIAVILYNAAKKSGKVFANTTIFDDNNMIAGYAKEAVTYMAGANIINGVGNNTFAPLDNATRAQAAKLIYGLVGGIN